MKPAKKPELLAPAGDFEKLRTAIHYGADAVYIGDSRFSLRGRAGNFGPDEMADAVSYAHAKGIRAYVTVNVFAHNADLPDIEEHIRLLSEIRPDAAIVSDPGVFAMFREKAPEIDLHVSTQANITNEASARFWEKLGAKRLVLSRELSIEEIKRIRSATAAELEVFVHGAICISYSGRCYISSFLTMRGANAGECTNSCRWGYSLMEEKRPGEYFPVFEDERGTYLMSSRDLCMIEHLPLLAAAGIDSFKIEGRMKGVNYVAGVVKAYREAVDSIPAVMEYNVRERLMRELSMFGSRGYTTGMFFGKQPDEDYNSDGSGCRMSHELVAIVAGLENGMAALDMRNRLDRGDMIEFLTPGLEEQTFETGEMFDADGLAVDSVRNGDRITMRVPVGVRKNDLIRRAAGMRRKDAVFGKTDFRDSRA